MNEARRWHRRAASGVALVLLIACTGNAWAADRAASTLRVFAAASLADAFGELAGAFEKAHPAFAVQLNLAGSQQLATQIELGAPADVFAAADPDGMERLAARGRLGGAPAPFARNRLVVIVPRANPARITRLQDLGRPGIKLVIAAPAVPVGKYSRAVLERLSRTDGFDPGFAARTLANVVSEEENVKSVAGKVQIGEADAGIVYHSDVTRSLARFVRTIGIPAAANVLATYPIAVLGDSRHADAAREFVALVLSPAGQRVIQRGGLIPIAKVAP